MEVMAGDPAVWNSEALGGQLEVGVFESWVRAPRCWGHIFGAVDSEELLSGTKS